MFCRVAIHYNAWKAVDQVVCIVGRTSLAGFIGLHVIPVFIFVKLCAIKILPYTYIFTYSTIGQIHISICRKVCKVKITTFNPVIITPDPEPTIQLFEELGFKRHHTKQGIGMHGVTDVRMKNADGFYLDISQGDGQWTMIRMNVDNFDEAVEFLTEHGFRWARHEAANETIETGSSKIAIMVSPSGFIFSISEHLKNR